MKYYNQMEDVESFNFGAKKKKKVVKIEETTLTTTSLVYANGSVQVLQSQFASLTLSSTVS